MSAPVLILSRRDIAALMTPADYLAAVEAAFRAEREGRAHAPPPMHIDGDGGAFHGKAAFLKDSQPLVALKLNGNFPGNPAQGLPTIQGAILLADAANGVLLAIMDSIEVTLQRTAAASALAARYLARADAETLLICGCGDQAPAQLAALLGVRQIARALAFDIDRAKAERLAAGARARHGIDIAITQNLGEAALASDIVVTATTAREPVLFAGDIRPGAFVAAVGADNPEKNEIAPDLMAAARLVCDAKSQCAVMGDLRAAIATGVMAAEDIHAELGEIVTGEKPARRSPEEIFIFDSTGTAIEDVATAAVIFERASERGAGRAVALGAL